AHDSRSAIVLHTPRMSSAYYRLQTVNDVWFAESSWLSASRTQLDAFRHLAGRHQPPQGDEQLARQRHDHGFARGAAAIGGALAEPLDEPAVLLEDQKAPGQLYHAAADPAVAGAGQSLLAPAHAALVRRAGQSGIARNSSAIAQIARQRLIHQHVGGLNADAKNPCNQT